MTADLPRRPMGRVFALARSMGVGVVITPGRAELWSPPGYVFARNRGHRVALEPEPDETPFSGESWLMAEAVLEEGLARCPDYPNCEVCAAAEVFDS